jgi:hypothetical protein
MTLDGSVFYFTSSATVYAAFSSTSKGDKGIKGIKGRWKGIMDDDMKEIIPQCIMNSEIIHSQFCL